MKIRSAVMLLATGVLATGMLTGSALAQQLYRWVDENGVVHYGDRIPPQYAGSTRDVLNEQGITVRSEGGTATEEQMAERARLEAEAAAEREARAEIARRDRMLLETYLSVADIERVRDQRLEMLESQIVVTGQYVDSLRERLQGLLRERRRFSPHAEREDAPPMPASLAQDIARTEASIEVHERNLVRTREEQETLRASFARDIARFKELRGG